MVRVGTGYSLQHVDFYIGLVIAIGVLQKPDLRQCRDQHPATPEFKSGNAIEFVGERDATISDAIAVVVRQADDFVAPWFRWIPVWVRVPNRYEKSSVGVDRHLDRVDDLGKHFLRRVQIDLHSFRDGHLIDRLFATKITDAFHLRDCQECLS